MSRWSALQRRSVVYGVVSYLRWAECANVPDLTDLTAQNVCGAQLGGGAEPGSFERTERSWRSLHAGLVLPPFRDRRKWEYL